MSGQGFEKPEFTNVKILVVDDEEDLREIIAEDFTSAGAIVLTAKGGHEAFEIVKNEKPTVVLSDVRMPGGDGVELLKRIREIYVDAPPHVFLLTGFADIQEAQAIAQGARGLVQKPFNLKYLRERVSEVLRSKPQP